MRGQGVLRQCTRKIHQPVGARAAGRGRLCEVLDCCQIAFVSVKVARKRRQLCLTHYEELSQGFSGNSGRKQTA
jgi:hypothetical protein